VSKFFDSPAFDGAASGFFSTGKCSVTHDESLFAARYDNFASAVHPVQRMECVVVPTRRREEMHHPVVGSYCCCNRNPHFSLQSGPLSLRVHESPRPKNSTVPLPNSGKWAVLSSDFSALQR
jgi:hypothetical protein